MILARIPVRAVHHHAAGQALLAHGAGRLGHVFAMVVGARGAAAQDDVTVLVARGLYDRGHAIGVDAQKSVSVAGREHGVDGILQ